MHFFSLIRNRKEKGIFLAAYATERKMYFQHRTQQKGKVNFQQSYTAEREKFIFSHRTQQKGKMYFVCIIHNTKGKCIVQPRKQQKGKCIFNVVIFFYKSNLGQAVVLQAVVPHEEMSQRRQQGDRVADLTKMAA